MKHRMSLAMLGAALAGPAAAQEAGQPVDPAPIIDRRGSAASSLPVVVPARPVPPQPDADCPDEIVQAAEDARAAKGGGREPLAKEAGGAAGGTAAQIAAGAMLGPIGAAVAAVVGTRAG